MDDLNMIRALLDEAPPSAEVIAEGHRRIAASATQPGRPARRRIGGYRHRTARRVAVAAVAAGAAAAVALATLVPHAAPAARPSRSEAGELGGQPARGFLLTMAVKAAGASPSTGRWYCQEMEEGQRLLVGADDTTLQAPWDQGPAASLVGYRYALFSKTMIQSCFEPPTKGAPYGTVEGATQSLGAQPASPADAAAWRQAGSPASWIAWYDRTVRITMAPGRQYFAGPRPLTGKSGYGIVLPTSAAQLRAFFLDHRAEFHEAGTTSEILYNDATGAMTGRSAPAVRAAAYRVLAGLPGIRMQPNVQDPAGQTGTAVWLPQAGPTLAMVIVDPATSTWLGVEEVTKRSVAHAAAGTIIDYTLFTRSGWTNTPRSG
jgi:hypothetical protein